LSRLARASAVLAILFALVVAGGSASGSSPVAHAAGKCGFHGTEQQHLGASYVTSLSVSHVSCATGKSVVKAFNKCRHSSGGARGRCHHKVLRYSCKEGRRTGISTQYDGSATCSRGSRRVHFTFTENT
jgi:hypothetical protein